MAKSVIILGAGASVHAGAPVMANFMEKARELSATSGDNDFKASFETVDQAISDLQLVFAKSFLDLENIETLFGAVEMARYIDRLGSQKGRDIENIRNEFLNLVSYTLEYSMSNNGTSSNGLPLPSQAYDELVQGIKASPDEFSVLTFNYDLGLDYALSYYDIEIDYGLKPEQSKDFKLLKLHGSLNWGLCECGQINSFSLKGLVKEMFARKLALELDSIQMKNRISIKLLMNQLKVNHKHSSNATDMVDFRFGPAIIPPTWTKSEYYLPIKEVWKQAALELSQAQNIYVAGYSLPETDLFFPYLYSLSTLESSTRINRFWVFNLDGGESIKRRYQQLIGKGIERNYRFIAMDFRQVPGEIFR